jgi:hypothetical protein
LDEFRYRIKQIQFINKYTYCTSNYNPQLTSTATAAAVEEEVTVSERTEIDDISSNPRIPMHDCEELKSMYNRLLLFPILR